ncbi:CaiB/BaiF CoA transferase family protein [Ruegeria jejuensis]|uniref:CaiB/BaiF CoA transferase family protein n=1 Tax=Ruegeria jejuensis TaxID=3233338 RepID=UPI00355B4EE3
MTNRVPHSDAEYDLPLTGVRVLDFSQFLAGPMCSLRLADLGAEVIKIERPKGGDLCRGLAVGDQWLGDDSLLFHTINRNKASVTADLKKPGDLDAIKTLIGTADVMIHNFRPGVMERIGLGYDAVSAMNPGLIYGVVSGYGTEGPWRDKPGQDLLAQSLSGLVWLTGSADDPPIPTGVSITDITAGMHLAQGVLAALFAQSRNNKGRLVEVSLLASAMDLQFEQFTGYLNSPRELPQRAAVNGANVQSSAPYGLYQTSDGYLAIAMTPIAKLAELLPLPTLAPFSDPAIAFSKRDQIKQIIADHLQSQPTDHWLGLLEPADIWCARVLDWPTLEASGALDALDVVQDIDGAFRTTTCPIRLDGRTLSSNRPAPPLGNDTAHYRQQTQSYAEVKQ